MSSQNLLADMTLRPAFVLIDLEAETNTDVLAALAGRLFEEGMVKDTFQAAILKREADYCTGLAFEEMGVAIPHTDPEHVNEACVAIAALKKPVQFQSMGMPEVPCETELVFMLAITDPNKQISFLQALMQTFGEPGKLKALKACTTSEELAELFRSYF